jgi:transposase
VRRTLRTRLPLLTSRQQSRLTTVFADEAHLAVLVTWSIYQRIIAAYSQPDRRRGQDHDDQDHRPATPWCAHRAGGIAHLGRTLHPRRHDVLAYFDHHASKGPIEAINGRLEALRRNALGFRNLTHYRIRSLLHCGNLIQQINAL